MDTNDHDGEDPQALLAQSELLWNQAQQPHECTFALRTRTFANSSIHIVRQCTICGEQREGPLSKAQAAQELAGSVAEPFDEGKARLYQAARSELLQRATAWRERALQLLDPEDHEFMEDLRRSNAAAREERDRRRAASTAALDAAFAQALASNGPLVFAEVAGQAIDKLAPALNARLDSGEADPARFTSEAELRQWLEGWLAQDFEWTPEVPGRHLTEGVPVKIDYLLYPRQHLTDAGFKRAPLGLEVKFLNQDKDKGFATKASRLVWQAVSYTDCEFKLEGSEVRVQRVLLFTNLSFRNELAMLSGVSRHALSNDRAKWTAMLEVANHANVGVLEITGHRDGWTGWQVAFATGKYFRRHLKRYELRNKHLFEKVRIGNF